MHRIFAKLAVAATTFAVGTTGGPSDTAVTAAVVVPTTEDGGEALVETVDATVETTARIIVPLPADYQVGDTVEVIVADDQYAYAG